MWLWKRLPEVLFFSYIFTFWFSKIFGVLQRTPKYFEKMLFFVIKFGFNLICVFLFWCITLCFLLSQLEQIHTYEWISKAKTCFVKSTQTGWNPNVHSDWKLEHTSNICFQWVKTLVLEIRCIPSLWYIFQYVSKIHL